MICSWCWFIHPATAISTKRNGSRTLGIVSSLSRDLRTAVALFHADPVSGPYGMGFCRAPLFRKRQFAAEIIVTCVRWYLRFSLSLRDVEELMAERGLSVDHTTVWRWTQTY